eukprot:gnl/Trimastix_PCT/189.p1 GENE.gnl/Trimastix_PCT/189~~gnl/Trimastix_PCT/189.p1  ORF type:complete len:107 (+),score=20.55 gnl/Trimastix_PCT/189:86-406(+)
MISNLQRRDPFAVEEEEESGDSFTHIRVQARSGRKSMTFLHGLNPRFDLTKLVKAFKKEFACNGNITTLPEIGTTIKLQGDHRQDICQFLVREGIVPRDKIKIHGA